MRGRLLAVLCGGDALSSGQFMLLFPGDEWSGASAEKLRISSSYAAHLKK
jgi:hypothetical protein